jgi:hypothetical protein
MWQEKYAAFGESALEVAYKKYSIKSNGCNGLHASMDEALDESVFSAGDCAI